MAINSEGTGVPPQSAPDVPEAPIAKPSLKKALAASKAVMLIAVLMVAFVGGLAGAFVYQTYVAPSPEEVFLAKLSDTQYDEDYLLASLKGVSPMDASPYFRPIMFTVYQNGSMVYVDLCTGMLAGHYVYAPPVTFEPLYYREVAAAVSAGILQIDIQLVADNNQDDQWKFEKLKLVYLGATVVVFERQPPLVFPDETSLPFAQGRLEDLNTNGQPDALYGMGTFYSSGQGIFLHSYQGSAEAVMLNEGTFLCSAAVLPYDLGGPMFALRDGEMELVGFLYYGESGKAIGVGIETVLAEVAQAGFPIEVTFQD